jgi:hypothetical protein
MKHLCRETTWLQAAIVAVGCASPQADSQAPVSAMTADQPAVSPPAGAAAPRPGQSAATSGMGAPAASTPSTPSRGGAGAGAAGQSAAPGGRSPGSSANTPAAAGSGGVLSGSTADTQAGAAGTTASSSAAQALPAITDYGAAGPFETKVEPNSGPDGNYTIYRPEPLGTDGFMHSPIIFGPGIATSCAPNGSLNIYTELLNHFASHGFVTICANSLSGGPNAPGNLTAMQAGLDWIIEQNGPSGTFQGKLAAMRAVAMGYSIGATASTQLSSHAAVMTTVSIHGHNTMGDPHGPIWLVTGTMDVIDDNRKTLTTLTEAPAVLSALPIGHLDVVGELGRSGRYIAPLTAWLRYWVNGDQGAKHFILGDGCETCKSPWITPEANELWKAWP